MAGTPSQPSEPCRVLVVDDNVDVAKSMGMLLTVLGADSRVVYDGPAALEMLRSYRPMIALIDLGMPGMDGCELARRIRQEPGGEGVVLAALTGWDQDEERRRTVAAGFDHHFVKPVNAAVLENLLANPRRA